MESKAKLVGHPIQFPPGRVCSRREQRVPALAFTHISHPRQMDWERALRLKRGVVDPLGRYDFARFDPLPSDHGAHAPDRERERGPDLQLRHVGAVATALGLARLVVRGLLARHS